MQETQSSSNYLELFYDEEYTMPACVDLFDYYYPAHVVGSPLSPIQYCDCHDWIWPKHMVVFFYAFGTGEYAQSHCGYECPITMAQKMGDHEMTQEIEEGERVIQAILSELNTNMWD